MTGSLGGESRGLGARPVDTEDGNNSRLSAIGILACRLAHFFWVAFRVKKIVGDLKREAKIMTVRGQRAAPGRGGASQNRASLATEEDQCARLHALKSVDVLQFRRRVLESDIHHLAADHAGI